MRSLLLWIAVVVCLLCSVAAVVQSGSSDGFGKPRDTETAISFLEYKLMAPSVPMIPLTLIHGADSKGAGTHSLSLSLSFSFVLLLWDLRICLKGDVFTITLTFVIHYSV